MRSGEQKDRMITSRKIRVPDQTGDAQDKVLEVRYDRHSDKFYVEIPGYLTYKADEATDQVTGPTPKEALDATETVCQDYKGTIIKKRRVIIYQFGWKKRGEESHGLGESDHKGAGLRVHWHACWEFRTGPLRRYQWDEKYTKGSIQFGETEARPSKIEGDWVIPRDHWKDPWKVIEWTQEREDFFRELERGLVALVDRAKQILGSQKKLGAMIDARPTTRLLEGPK